MNIKQLLAACALTPAVLFAPAAYAHAKLEASSPKANSVLATSPAALRLQFNEPVELAFSKVRLVNDTNAVIAPRTITLDKASPKVMVATLPPLKSGPYRVQWTALTRDGHKVKGEFAFRVR